MSPVLPPSVPPGGWPGLVQLDADRAQPVYLQLVDALTRLMSSGVLAEGQHLPAERVLAAELGVSRTTVKRAYDHLREADNLSTHGRGGTVVRQSPKVAPELARLKGFSQEMQELGMTPSTQVLSRRIVQDRTMASVFTRPSTAQFLQITRVRLADGCPMSREVAWYDLTVAPELADWDGQGSAYGLLKAACGIELERAEQSVEAVMSDAQETRVFGFERPGPCLLLKRHTYASTGQLVEYVEGTFRGDAYAYRHAMKP